MTVLQQRILTAAILLPLVVSIILFATTVVVEISAGIILILAAWEWFKLMGLCRPAADATVRVLNKQFFTQGILIWLLMLALITLAIAVRYYLAISVSSASMVISSGAAGVIDAITLPINQEFSSVVWLITAGWWLLALLAVIIYPCGQVLWRNRSVGFCLGCLIFIPCWLAIGFLHRVDPALLLYACALVWLADSVAYFAGRRWGRRKLLPAVSPGKTWFGAAAALLFTPALAVPILLIWRPELNLLALIVLSMITVLAGIVGDLWESLFKRLRNFKDSGSLLPGHGGVLDRIDALLAALPIFSLVLVLYA